MRGRSYYSLASMDSEHGGTRVHLFPLERRWVVVLEGEIFQRSQPVFHVPPGQSVFPSMFHRVPLCSISPYHSYYYYSFLLWKKKEQIRNTVKTYRYQGNIMEHGEHTTFG